MAKMEGTLAMMLLLHLAAAAIPTDASPPIDCPSKCGNVEIPYPYGIGDRCAISTNFTLNCTNTRDGGDKPFIRDMEVVEILLPQAQIRLYNNISYRCYNPTNNIIEDHEWTVTLRKGKTFNSSLNKFTVIGCNTLAYISLSNSKTTDSTEFQTGCMSTCPSQESLSNGSCDGIGCCQTSIPKGLRVSTAWFDDRFNSSGIYNFSPCSYAVLMEAASFRFLTSYVTTDAFNKSHSDGSVPVVLDWAIGDGTKCEAAKHNKSSYACVGPNSECVDAANGLGYTCHCANGYEGNPYLQNGCADINECAPEHNKVCNGECRNFNGTYECFCLPGTHSSNPATEACLPDQKLALAVKLAIGICSSLAILLFCSMCAYTILEKKRFTKLKQHYFRDHAQLLQAIKGQQGVVFKIFKIEELKKATNNFNKNRILGCGGHGIVYKGVLENRRVVAIKKAKLIDETQKTEYGKEILILSQVNHKNIIKLLGCCLEVEVPVLVYEFVPNRTLFQLIQEKNTMYHLSVGARLRIAYEIADALAYLHSSASPPIIHRDVKSSNILLDENYTVKVSDFGSSKLVPKDKNQLATLVQGTFGYLDPEYVQTCNLTEKSDVYSFGVVLLELLTGKRAIYVEEARVEVNLTSSFLLAMKEKRLHEILDNKIVDGGGNMELILKLCELAKQCLHISGEERPSMREVAVELHKLRKFIRELQVENYEQLNLSTIKSSNNHGSNTITSYAYQELETISLTSGR